MVSLCFPTQGHWLVMWRVETANPTFERNILPISKVISAKVPIVNCIKILLSHISYCSKAKCQKTYMVCIIKPLYSMNRIVQNTLLHILCIICPWVYEQKVPMFCKKHAESYDII